MNNITNSIKYTVVTILMGLTLLPSGVLAADMYMKYNLLFSGDIPAQVKLVGAECTTTNCDVVDEENALTVYSAGAAECNYYYENSEANAFEDCMKTYEVNDNVVSLDQSSETGNLVYLKFDSPAAFSYMVYAFSGDDSYMPVLSKAQLVDCETDICVGVTEYNMSFAKKENGLVVVSRLNVRNTKDDIRPVEINVPVSISVTACSAFRYSDPGAWRPTPPSGFADYSSGAIIELTVLNNNTQEQYYGKSLLVAVGADACLPIGPFTYTPLAGKLARGDELRFVGSSQIVDSQLILSREGRVSATKTIY